MAENRLFLPQEAVDAWLAEGKITLDDDLLTVAGGIQLRLVTALRFLEEVSDGNDPHGLVGTVRTLERVTEMQGEHYADSVVLGDNAYQVVEGFMGVVLLETVPAGGDSAEAVSSWLAGV